MVATRRARVLIRGAVEPLPGRPYKSAGQSVRVTTPNPKGPQQPSQPRPSKVAPFCALPYRRRRSSHVAGPRCTVPPLPNLLLVTSLLLLTLEGPCATSAGLLSMSQAGGPLMPGRIVKGLIQAYGDTSAVVVYQLNVSQCRQYGKVLISLLSPDMPTTSAKPPSPSEFSPKGAPPPAPDALFPNEVFWNATLKQPAQTSLSSPWSENPFLAWQQQEHMPLLLVNTQGVTPLARSVRENEFYFNNFTVPADFAGYQAQAQQQVFRAALPEALANDTMDLWAVGVLIDAKSMPALPIRYQLQASCSDPPPCPGNCSWRGQCLASGRCLCYDGWVGPACASPLQSLPDDALSYMELAPFSWHYYALNISSGDKVLAELSRWSGDPVLFMKPEASGFLPYDVPTVYDYGNFSDAQVYRQYLVDQHILWTNATGGPALIGVFNNAAQAANYSLNVSMAPGYAVGNSGEGEYLPLCPQNCNEPRGYCIPGNVSAPDSCQCTDGYIGPQCEGTLHSINLGYSLQGRLPALKTVYFMPNFQSTNNITVEIVYKGGTLFLMVSADGTVPTMASNDTQLMQVLAEGIAMQSVFSIGPVPQEDLVLLGIYNAHETEDAILKIRFYDPDDDQQYNFARSPFMIIIVSILGVTFLALFCIGIRRAACGGLFLQEPAAAAPVNSLTEGRPTHRAPSRCRGIPKEVVASFPVLKYEKDGNILADSDEHLCIVCLGDYEDGDSLRKLPACDHLFHMDCVDLWLSHHDTCPLCRSELQAPSPHTRHDDITSVASGLRSMTSSLSSQGTHEVSGRSLSDAEVGRSSSLSAPLGGRSSRDAALDDEDNSEALNHAEPLDSTGDLNSLSGPTQRSSTREVISEDSEDLESGPSSFSQQPLASLRTETNREASPAEAHDEIGRSASLRLPLAMGGQDRALESSQECENEQHSVEVETASENSCTQAVNSRQEQRRAWWRSSPAELNVEMSGDHAFQRNPDAELRSRE